MPEAFEKYTIQGHTISENIDVFFDLWDMTPEAYDALEKAEKAADRAKPGDYDRIARAIKKYPHIPLFKDTLIRYHINKGENDKINELNDKVIRQHPEYLAAFVHKALRYCELGEFSKMPEILGKNFDLKAFYPNRTVFHIDEFLKMQYVAVLYFYEVGEFEKAEDRLRIMNETGPYEEITILARDFIKYHLEIGSEVAGKDNDSALYVKHIHPLIPKQLSTKKKKAPALNHSEVKNLYTYRYDLPKEIIEKIKLLPRKTVIEDLVSLLDDSISRYTHLTEGIDGFEADEIPVYHFVVNAIFMLAEIEATESRTIIYKVLNQSEDYDIAFLSGIFERELIDPLYILLAGDPKRIVETIKQPAQTTSQRTLLLDILEEIALQEPDKKPLIERYYNELLDFFLASKPEDNVQDNILMDALALSLTRLDAKESYSKIRDLKSQKMLLRFHEMDDEEFEEMLYDTNAHTVNPLLFVPMAEKYAQIEKELQDESDMHENEADDYTNPLNDVDLSYKFKRQPQTTDVQTPAFNHPIIEELYDWDFDIPEDKVEAICALPRKTLIEDLETVLRDSVNRFTHFTRGDYEGNTEFVTHAIFMLAEVKAVESTPLILETLGQSEEYFDWFLIDIYDQNLLNPLYILLDGNAADLSAFIKLPQKATGSRMIALDLLKEIALQEPARKLLVLGYHRQIIDFLLSGTPEDSLQDPFVTDGIIMNLIDLGANTLLPEINKLLDLEMSLFYKTEDMDTIEKAMTEGYQPPEKLPLLPMIAQYREVQAEIDEMNEAFESDEENGVFDRDAILSKIPGGVSQKEFMSLMEKASMLISDRELSQNEPDIFNKTSDPAHKMSVVESPKVGRNEPCPCGSEKKYKKCCLRN